jgi:hypothetical protein
MGWRGLTKKGIMLELGNFEDVVVYGEIKSRKVRTGWEVLPRAHPTSSL